ncbi:retrovirus-related pol polyprotein from transposon TNT 1-94, partial [Tanacetum coccineum]
MRERHQDPLALVANHQQTPHHFNNHQSSYNNPLFQQQFSPSQSQSQYGAAHPSQHYSTSYPSSSLAISYPPAQHPNAYSSIVYQEACPTPQSIDSGLTVLVFNKGDDPIDAINKMMSFLSTVVSSRFPSTNNQLRNSSNSRQQAIINDGRVTVQPYQGRTNSYVAGTSGTRVNVAGTGGRNSSQQRVVKCFNCQGEGHMARQCTQPKRKREATWFKEKVLLVEAQGMGKVLSEEELEFLAHPGIPDGPVTHSIITQNAAYQAVDLDAYDSDCDDISTAKVAFMVNLSRYGSDVLSEVPNPDNTHNSMLNQSVHEMHYSEPSHLVVYPENEITSDSNIILYFQYLHESQNAVVQDTNSSAQQDAMILSMIEQMSYQVTDINKVNEIHLSANKSLSAELERYKERKNAQFTDLDKEINALKQTLSDQLKEKESLMKTVNVLKNESQEKEARNIDREIVLKRKKSIKNDLKQSDPKVEKLNTKPVDYAVLNQLSIDFGKRFVPQTELYAEQDFWSKNSPSYAEYNTSSTPAKTEVPKELPKVSMVNTSLKKLKYHLASFDKVVKGRTTPTAITEGSWEFEHTKAVFVNEVIPLLKTLKVIFDNFDQKRFDEITEVQTVFNQMEQVVEECRLKTKSLEIQKRHVLTENDRLLDQVMFHDIMNVAVKSFVNENAFVAMNEFMSVSDKFVQKCQKCLELKIELFKKDKVIIELSARFSNLEKHCISLEVAMQQNQEKFQIENSRVNQSIPEIQDYFETNDLKAQLQGNDTIINQLKDKVKALRKNPDRVKKEYDETETINIELEHSVAKLFYENENLRKEIMHLKRIFKELFNSIKKSRVSNTKHKDSLVAQMNLKSVKNVDLHVQIQEKVLANEALKNELKRIKGKYVVDLVAPKPKAITIAPGMFKIEIESLPLELFKNKETHIDYIQKSRENANVLQEIVEEVRASNPLDVELDLASDPVTSSEHKAKIKKKDRFAKPLESLSNSHKQVDSSRTSDSNKPVFPSIGLKSSTSVCRSQPSGNKRNDRISQPQRSNLKNKVEAQH